MFGGLLLSVGVLAIGMGQDMTTRTMLTAEIASPAFRSEVILEHPLDVVWGALTRKALIDRYYLAPIRTDITAAGAEIIYGPPEAKLITGVVSVFEAPRLLVHSFRFDGDTDSPDTTVTYRLTAAGQGTRLELIHAGYEVPSQGYADIEGGWPVILDRLKTLLDARR